MGRKKKFNGNVDNITVKVSTVDFYKLFDLLDEYNISQHGFSDMAGISSYILEKMHNGEYNFEICTLLTITTALNKLNPSKQHYINDIITEIYN